jgi:hypothetical protein
MRFTGNGRFFCWGTILTLSGLETDRVMVKNLFYIHAFKYGAHSDQRRLFALGLDSIQKPPSNMKRLPFTAL